MHGYPSPPARHIPLPTADEARANNIVWQIVPSKPNYWRDWRVEGQWYTYRQRRWMRETGRDPNTVETITVYSVTTSREFWVPVGDKMPIYDITCPVLAQSRDGSKVLVISPSGDRIWVGADGSLAGSFLDRKGWGE